MSPEVRGTPEPFFGFGMSQAPYRTVPLIFFMARRISSTFSTRPSLTHQDNKIGTAASPFIACFVVYDLLLDGNCDQSSHGNSHPRRQSIVHRRRPSPPGGDPSVTSFSRNFGGEVPQCLPRYALVFPNQTTESDTKNVHILSEGVSTDNRDKYIKFFDDLYFAASSKRGPR
jgi:hypothetical protein